MQQVLLVLHNMESMMTGTRNNRDIQVTINTFAAHTIAGPFALSPNTTNVNNSAANVTIQQIPKVQESPECFMSRHQIWQHCVGRQFNCVLRSTVQVCERGYATQIID
jgi:hypothetical protein